MSAPKGYSRSQIWLHWTVTVLVAIQYLFHDPIAHAWRQLRDGGTFEPSTMILLHVVSGVTILALVLWRVVLRLRLGTPEPVPGGNRVQELIAAATHGLLYLLLILMALSGLAAWFGGIAVAAKGHALMKGMLLILVGLHVLAALYHQFVRRDGLLVRMKTPAE